MCPSACLPACLSVCLSVSPVNWWQLAGALLAAFFSTSLLPLHCHGDTPIFMSSQWAKTLHYYCCFYFASLPFWPHSLGPLIASNLLPPRNSRASWSIGASRIRAQSRGADLLALNLRQPLEAAPESPAASLRENKRMTLVYVFILARQASGARKQAAPCPCFRS